MKVPQRVRSLAVVRLVPDALDPAPRDGRRVSVRIGHAAQSIAAGRAGWREADAIIDP